MTVQFQTNRWLVYLLLLIVALAFRLNVAHYLANDAPDDGRVYAQMARDLLEQHVFSVDPQPPYQPTLIRLPGYPLFLAGVYALFGHGNNEAVRLAQALIDTATCVLVALIAYNWASDPRRRRKTAIAVFLLAALCPFSTIYVATILTETVTMFLMAALALAATYALKAGTSKAAHAWWLAAGLCAGLAVFMRPDSGLFAAGVGLTLVLVGLWPRRRALVEAPAHEHSWGQRFGRVLTRGFVFSLVFALVLMPWAWRNWRVFHLFQPIAPAHGEMPGEFVPRGYNLWLRTWIDDERYIGPMLWGLDDQPIKLEQVPERAFASPDEKARVAALLEQYNHPPDSQPTDEEAAKDKADNSTDNDNDQADNDEDQASDEDQQSSDEPDEQTDETDQSEHADVEMTPAIDAGFAEIAHERIQRAPLRFYLWLPLKRACALWFDTHSQYYPFDGELFPLSELDYSKHQQFWLPLFALLTWGYTLLGLAGAWVLWRDKAGAGWRWLLLAALLTLPRLVFLSTLENPEPRYVVEIFPLLAVLGGIALGAIISAIKFKNFRLRPTR
jgi:Dolichyl-phosphate-mannose-protein mannosyltransferase